MTWNLNDLLKVAAVSLAVFTVLRVVLGRPLVRTIVNANRVTWLLVAGAFVTAGFGLLRDVTGSSNPLGWFPPLQALVLEERASGPVLVAGFALLNGVVLLGLLAYCRLAVPRHPSSFHKIAHLPRAVQYYCGLRGGLDYTVLVRLAKADGAEPEIVATGVNRAEIQQRLDATGRKELADDRVRKWLEIAVELHRELVRLNAVLDKGGQGGNRRVLLDVQFGGYLFQYVRPPKSGTDVLFLFAVTVLQQEVTNRQFEDHFELLFQAVRNITAATERL